MKTIRVTLKSGAVVRRYAEGTFRECQRATYAVYGRLNIARIQFRIADRWIDSPYLVNPLEAYDEQFTTK